jgi:hypothetical protein
MFNSQEKKLVNVVKIATILLSLIFSPIRSEAASSASPQRIWAFDRGVAAYYPASNGAAGQIAFSSPSGNWIFSHQLDIDASVSQVVASEYGIHILSRRRVNEGRFVHRVDYCNYSGGCSNGDDLDKNVFQISAYDVGFYAIMYEQKIFTSDAGAFPINGSVWKFSSGGMHKVCCSEDVNIHGIYFNKSKGLTLTGTVEAGALGKRRFGLYFVDSQGVLKSAPGFPSFGAENIPDLFPGSCDQYIYEHDKFFCIKSDGKRIDGIFSLVTFELSFGWSLVKSFKSISVPYSSDGEKLIYLDEIGSFRSIEVLE